MRRRIEAEMRGVVERGVADGVIEPAHPRMTALAFSPWGSTWRGGAATRARGHEQSPDHYCELAPRVVGAT